MRVRLETDELGNTREFVTVMKRDTAPEIVVWDSRPYALAKDVVGEGGEPVYRELGWSLVIPMDRGKR
jgi:hypothetical protein